MLPPGWYAGDEGAVFMQEVYPNSRIMQTHAFIARLQRDRGHAYTYVSVSPHAYIGTTSCKDV